MHCRWACACQPQSPGRISLVNIPFRRTNACGTTWKPSFAAQTYSFKPDGVFLNEWEYSQAFLAPSCNPPLQYNAERPSNVDATTWKIPLEFRPRVSLLVDIFIWNVSTNQGRSSPSSRQTKLSRKYVLNKNQVVLFSSVSKQPKSLAGRAESRRRHPLASQPTRCIQGIFSTLCCSAR